MFFSCKVQGVFDSRYFSNARCRKLSAADIALMHGAERLRQQIFNPCTVQEAFDYSYSSPARRRKLLSRIFPLAQGVGIF